jgi:antitoxin (DNA-binding transcriptional repressor) of toxin-antitoxin stability system
MKVDVQYAETHLADLISAASRGEIVEIDTPGACAQIYASPKPDAAKDSGPRVLGAARGMFAMPPLDDWDDQTVWTEPAIPRSEVFGCAKGKMHLSEDWDSPETNAEIADLFGNSKLFPETKGQ